MEAVAERLAPPCRLARRYDKVQRLAALNALFQDMQRSDGSGWRALDLLDVVDTVANALGMWMSPNVRDDDLKMQRLDNDKDAGSDAQKLDVANGNASLMVL